MIKNNPVVKSGIHGIPEAFTHESLHHFEGESKIYRPATIILFALEKSLFGFDPGRFHIVNLILYGLVCMAFYRLLIVLFPKFDWRLLLIASFLFLVHPVHTEVVANVKSQDELLAALGCLWSLTYLIRYLDSGSSKFRFLAWSVLFYLLAVFSKESSVFFIAIFPMTLFLLRKRSIKIAALKSMPYLVPVVIYMSARYLVLRNAEFYYERNILDNVLFGTNGLGELTATKASILLMFITKLFFPAKLSWDYSYNQVPITTWTSLLPWLSIALFLSLIAVAIYFLRKQPAVSWGISFFLLLILPTSNILFINLTTFAERFLFLPSAGAIVAFLPLMSLAARGSLERAGRMRPSFYLPFMGLLLLCAVLTHKRTADWKDNISLFESAASNAPNSSRVMAGLASEYMSLAKWASTTEAHRRYLEKSKESFLRSLQIHPGNSEAAFQLGLAYALTKDTSKAIHYYHQAIDHHYKQAFPFVNLSAIYVDKEQYDSALYYLDKSFALDSLDRMTLTNLTVVHYKRDEDHQVLKYVSIAERNGLNSEKITTMKSMSRKRLAENELPAGGIK